MSGTEIKMKPLKCTQCGAVLQVDPSTGTAVCAYCGTPYIGEKAVQEHTTNIENLVVNQNIHVEIHQEAPKEASDRKDQERPEKKTERGRRGQKERAAAHAASHSVFERSGSFGTLSPGKGYGLWIVLGAVFLILILIIRSCASGKDPGSESSSQQSSAKEPAAADPSEPADELRSITVSETEYGSLDVEGIFTGETITIPEETVVSYSGSISDENKEDTYTYTAPRDGLYRFELENVKANASLSLTVWDADRKTIADTYNNGASRDLTAGETYEIQVRKYNGATDYTLNIGVQKETVDISGAAVVDDQIAFKGQKNVYTFTAPLTGLYRFELTEVKKDLQFRMLMQDRLEKNIMDTYQPGGSVVLNEGETYDLQVLQYAGLGSYRMRLYFQKETKDITGYDVVNDSIEYRNQRNIYTFTAPVTGLYRFELTEIKADLQFRMMMQDRLDKNIMDTYRLGGSVVLNEGETYMLQVMHYEGLGSYKMRIGYQKETLDISDADLVYDRITYASQRNVYLYTPAETRKYILNLKDHRASCELELMVWDKYDDNILDQYDRGIVSLEAGQTYRIQVMQYKGFGPYCLEIQ